MKTVEVNLTDILKVVDSAYAENLDYFCILDPLANIVRSVLTVEDIEKYSNIHGYENDDVETLKEDLMKWKKEYIDK